MRDLRRSRSYLDWIVQNSLQLLLHLVFSIIAIHFCVVPRTLTSQGFTRVQNRLAHVVTKSPPVTKVAPPYVRMRMRVRACMRMRNKMARGHLSRSVSLCADACAEGNCLHSDHSM